jgi:hypothetical protein
MNPSLSLRDASVQDIQLDLIRRSSFNAFNGEQVVQSLLRHRPLWKAVLLDRPGLPNFTRPGGLLRVSLIPLRDLPQNIWNADMLFVLTVSQAAAHELARVIQAEDWGGEVRVYEDRDETDTALGTGRTDYGLLSVWWD